MSDITKEMNVAKVFESYPATHNVFKRYGFGALLNPVLRNTFGRFASIEKACRLHDVDLNEFLTALNQPLNEGQSRPGSISYSEARDPNLLSSSAVMASHADLPGANDSSALHMSEEELIKIKNILHINIRSIVEQWPEVREVFVKYFGEGCFSCPAFGMEDIEFACAMHNTDPTVFAKACLDIISRAPKKSSNAVVSISADQTVNEIMGKYPETLRVFHKYGVDSCCGGAHPIKMVATAHGIELEKLTVELLNTIKTNEK